MINTWDSRLFIAILLLLILPSLYQSYGMYLVGEKPVEQQHLAIAAQWQFIQVLLEIIQEGLILPLFFLVGSVKEHSYSEVVERLKAVFGVLVLILFPLLVLFLWMAPAFVDYTGTSIHLQDETVPYLRVKSMASILAIFNMGLITALECFRLPKFVLTIAITKVLLYICFDSFFYGKFAFSMNWGIQGYAWSSLCVELLLFLLLASFSRFKLGFISIDPGVVFSMKNWRIFFGISGWVILESTIRNVAYFMIILRLTNLQGASSIGGYYLSMHLLWGFALAPIIAMSDVSKVLIANVSDDPKQIKKILSRVFKYSTIIFSLWMIGLIFIDEILGFFTRDVGLKGIAKDTIYRLIPAYVVLSLTLIIDSLFIGTGKTKYLALKSIATNLLVYGSVYVVYLFGWWAPQYNELLTIFSVSILVGMSFTAWFVQKVLFELSTY